MTKDDSVYVEHDIVMSLTDKDRRTLRSKIVNIFLNEDCGHWKDGKKQVMRYKYYVESLADGRRIYLYRPTYLNKGIDFQVTVEKYDGAEDGRPSHEDILDDLKNKKANEPQIYLKLIEAITRVWNCEEPNVVMREYPGFNFTCGHSVELLLKALKWLFIEQDVTYWNYVGREKLMAAIKSV
ncbi:MAG: hypothetical protein NT051_06240 [Candidatus Micrarchaeota archaeon]|nr:hypothetical protein [Candidatus Micrarchaeota archaeon]